MRNVSFISAIAFAAATDAGTAAPSTDLLATVTAPVAPTVEAAKPAKLRTAPKPAKPATDKPAKAAKPVTAPVEPVEAEPAVRVLPITRTCATIAANATSFGSLSDRDHAYITYYAGLAKRAKNGVLTIRAIADHFAATGARPIGPASAKPHDAGVVNRLRKAGIVTVESDGSSFKFTKAATTHKSYAAG